jgi:hypothetical protein
MTFSVLARPLVLPCSGVAVISCERKGENRSALASRQISKNFASSQTGRARARKSADRFARLASAPALGSTNSSEHRTKTLTDLAAVLRPKRPGNLEEIEMQQL